MTVPPLEDILRPRTLTEGGLSSLRGLAPSIALAAGRRGFSADSRGLSECRAFLAERTVCLTLLAGAGTRWTKSLALARESLPPDSVDAAAVFDPAKPRGLFPVRNFLAGMMGTPSPDRIPMAAYALAATRDLGRALVVVRGHEAEIESGILGPLGFPPGSYGFFTQVAPYGKPLGHGDAAYQCRGLWGGADYLVANFGGDANSRLTVLSALLALDALVSSGEDVDLLLPAALVDDPAYPIRLDARGIPIAFGHAKLQGSGAPRKETATAVPGGKAYTNVGVRVYRVPALLAVVEGFRRDFWREGEGYAIPGNDPAGLEFALDNVDASLAASGRARILPIARPEELAPVKSWEDMPAFEAAAEIVTAEDRAAGLYRRI